MIYTSRYITIIMIFVIFGCPVPVVDFPSGTLKVQNNSELIIYPYFSCTDSVNIENSIRDTIFLDRRSRPPNGDSVFVSDDQLQPDSFDNFGSFGSPRSKVIPCNKRDFITVFFIADSTIQKYSWSEIVKHQYHLEKRRYTRADLDSLDWEITYP